MISICVATTSGRRVELRLGPTPQNERKSLLHQLVRHTQAVQGRSLGFPLRTRYATPSLRNAPGRVV